MKVTDEEGLELHSKHGWECVLAPSMPAREDNETHLKASRIVCLRKKLSGVKGGGAVLDAA